MLEKANEYETCSWRPVSQQTPVRHFGFTGLPDNLSFPRGSIENPFGNANYVHALSILAFEFKSFCNGRQNERVCPRLELRRFRLFEVYVPVDHFSRRIEQAKPVTDTDIDVIPLCPRLHLRIAPQKYVRAQGFGIHSPLRQ